MIAMTPRPPVPLPPYPPPLMHPPGGFGVGFRQQIYPPGGFCLGFGQQMFYGQTPPTLYSQEVISFLVLMICYSCHICFLYDAIVYVCFN